MKLPDIINVLLLGNGGREHAFAEKIAQSSRVAKLYIAKGNGGTAACGTNVDVDTRDFAAVKQFVLVNNIHLVVVGPEEPLVRGIYDFFENDSEIRYIPVVGPSKQGAMLEGSKRFAKEFMRKHNIPTAAYASFDKNRLEEGYAFLESLKPPYVLKADGLAAGKGVVIVPSLEEAKRELADMLSGKFGVASRNVVIEEYLSGIELSVFVATDGKSYKLLPEAKDYKRIGEGDKGLNTGGMGAVSPVPFADKAFMDKVVKKIVEPTVKGLAEDNINYRGFVFIGLMKVGDEPYVIEYNVRMGDPETEVVMPRIQSDIIDLFDGIVYGSLKDKILEVTPQAAATVVAVAAGYPEAYEKGKEITGELKPEGSTLYHAGTTVKEKRLVTNGGRVLAVTSLGDNLQEALDKSYRALEGIRYDGIYYRRDIGRDVLK